MSIIKWFNKPKWQSPNEQVRITAIKSSEDREMLEALPEIIVNDSSIKVQKAALSRLVNPNALLKVLNTHNNKSIQKLASKKLVHWFGSDENPEQIEIFSQINDPETIKTLAQVAHSSEIRKSALGQIKQQGLLGDLLLAEQDPTLQQLILDKIDQPSTLSRLEKLAGKKSSDLKAKIHAKLATGQDSDHKLQAIALCEQLENVVHGKKTGVDLADIKTQWSAITEAVPANLQTRFNGAYAAAKMILDPIHRDQFLTKQKQQRTIMAINELAQFVAKNNALSLPQIQTAIQKYQDLETADLATDDAARFKLHFETLLATRDEIQKEQQIPAAATDTLDQIDKVLGQPIVQPDQLERFKKQWHKAIKQVKPSPSLDEMIQQFDHAKAKLVDKIEASADLRQQAAQQAVDLIDSAIEQIKEGHLAKAKVITNQIAQHKKTAGYSHPIIKRNKYQLDQVWNQLKDLRNWQKWSNDKARQDIIDELKAMVGKGLHPDAVLKKLKDSNEHWYALEDMEKLAGDKFASRNQKMWQDFRAVSKNLFEPTQPFFEKRSEQQDHRLDAINASIEQMNNLDLEQSEERELLQHNRQAIKHLKSLDQLPPKQRGKVAKNLRQAINRIDDKLNQFYSTAEKKKQRLIDQARELLELEDLSAAIAAAIQLQNDWKQAGMVKQHKERKLWKQFRKANDAVFNRRDQEKQQQNQAHQAQLKATQALLKQHTTQLTKARDEEALTVSKQQLMADWHALDKPEKLLAHEFNHLLQKFSEKSKRLTFEKVLEVYAQKQQLDDQCAQFEQGTIKQEQINKILAESPQEPWTDQFKNRIQNPTSDIALTDLLIQAEFLTGMDTPAEFMEQRMAYQVKILAERMSGERELNNQQQAMQWLDDWYSAPKSDKEFMQKQTKRANKVTKAMLELIQE